MQYMNSQCSVVGSHIFKNKGHKFNSSSLLLLMQFPHSHTQVGEFCLNKFLNHTVPNNILAVKDKNTSYMFSMLISIFANM